jgi:hypothetical protein
LKKALFILFFSSLYLLSDAQLIKGGIIGGLNISQVDGDQVYGFKKFGFTAGPTAIIPLSKRFQLSLEVLYSQKGSSQAPVVTKDIDDSTREYRLKLNYAEIPLLLHYVDKHGLNAGLGLSFGRLVFVKEKEFNHDTKKVEWNDVKLNDGTYNKNDYEIIFDLQMKVYAGLYANLRYSYSLSKIRSRYYFYPFNKWRDQYNNVITLRAIWVINDKPAEPKKIKE